MRACYCAENSTVEDSIGKLLMSVQSAAVDNELNVLSDNTSIYDDVASTLSERLLAVLAHNARPSTINSDQNNVSPANTTQRNFISTLAPTSRRSWEQFLAQIVSNLTSRAKAVRPTTPAKFTPTTSTTATQSLRNRKSPVIDTTTSPPSVSTSSSSSADVARQQQQQQQQLSAVRSYKRFHHHVAQVGSRRHIRPGLSRSPLNLKSPPVARFNRLEESTNMPSRSWKATTRLPPLTTPPAYPQHVMSLSDHIHRRQQLHHHQRHHQVDVRHQRVIKSSVAAAAASSLRHNSTHNNARTVWSTPASQLSAASLFRMLGLWRTGNDVNVTSSSVTVADMMRYVLAQATRVFRTGLSL